MLLDTYAWQKSLITVERPSTAAKEAASYPNNDSDGDSQRREGKVERSDGKKEAMALVFTLPNLPLLLKQRRTATD